jgi:hypothetical protein
MLYQVGLPGPFVLDDVAFTVQPLEGAANRRPAQAQTLGDFGLDDPGARGQIAANDQLAEGLERTGDTAAVVGFDCRSWRSGRLAAGFLLGRHVRG